MSGLIVLIIVIFVWRQMLSRPSDTRDDANAKGRNDAQSIQRRLNGFAAKISDTDDSADFDLPLNNSSQRGSTARIALSSEEKALKSDTFRSAVYSESAAEQLDSHINSRRVSGYRRKSYDTARAGHMHIRDIRGLALEDREHDWLAQQMKEEEKLGNFCVDSAMDRLKLDHLKKHKMIHFD